MSSICGLKCGTLMHEIRFSRNLKKISGFESQYVESVNVVENKKSLKGNWPANLANAITSNIMIYIDIS